MERVSCVQGALADQSVNTDLAFLLSSKHRVTQNLKHQPGPLGPAEEVLLVVTPEELVKLVQSEGRRVVVRRQVGHGLLHHVGDAEGGEKPSRPVVTRIGLSLRKGKFKSPTLLTST